MYFITYFSPTICINVIALVKTLIPVLSLFFRHGLKNYQRITQANKDTINFVFEPDIPERLLCHIAVISFLLNMSKFVGYSNSNL